MPDNDWAANSDWIPDGGEPYAEVDNAGGMRMYDSQRANRNRLQNSEDGRVARLGDWLAATPSFMPNGMAALGGFLVGLRIGQLHPEDVDEIMDLINDDERDLGPLDAVVDLVFGD